MSPDYQKNYATIVTLRMQIFYFKQIIDIVNFSAKNTARILQPIHLIQIM